MNDVVLRHVTQMMSKLTIFFEQLRQGDQDAAERLWECCAPRILAVARKTLAYRAQRISDHDDVAQSVFVSLWTQATKGNFSEDFHRENLWRLLTTMTVRRALKHQAREQTRKRGRGRVQVESSVAPSGAVPFRLDQAMAQVSNHEFDVLCEEQLLRLDEDLRAIAVLRLMNHTQDEIAAALNCSISTVERKLRLIRKLWRDGDSD